MKPQIHPKPPILANGSPMAHRTSGSIRVEVSDTQSCLSIDRAAIAHLTRSVLQGEGVESALISLAIVDDATIHELNRRHLGHDWPTDVITFRLSDLDDLELSAEIVLSAEMAATTALAADVDAQAELSLYLVHGLLHLCGYDDQSPSDRAAMRGREASVLEREGLPNTYLATGESAESASERETYR